MLLDEGLLLVRQSHTEGDEVMATTKTKIRQRITLPPLLVDILRWHIDTQLTTDAMRQSELLFPAEDGGFRSRSALKKPFVAVAAAIGMTKHVSPKAMRRTFQDLARAAEVKDIADPSHLGPRDGNDAAPLLDGRGGRRRSSPSPRSSS